MRNSFLTVVLISGFISMMLISCDDNSKSLGKFGIDIATVLPEGDHAYSYKSNNKANKTIKVNPIVDQEF